MAQSGENGPGIPGRSRPLAGGALPMLSATNSLSCPQELFSEFRACLFCSANERYELLAAEIRQRFGDQLSEMSILELDPRSPLKPLLSGARKYTRSFFEEGCSSGERDGAVCEDITALKFDNHSLDLIISSDVLEHVPYLDKAFSETARVLKPGGAHIFTVPPRAYDQETRRHQGRESRTHRASRTPP